MTLRHGDCLEVMRDLPNNSVDLVLTDPPYAVTACEWDRLPILPELFNQVHRIAKSEAAVIMTATQPFATDLINANRDRFKYDWVWCKSRATDFVRAKIKPMGGHEYVLVFSDASVANGAKQNMNYYPQGLVRVNRTCKNGGGGVGFLGRNKSNLGPNNKLHQETYSQEFTGYPNTKIEFQSESNTVHPTQKPVALMEYLIATYTRPGATVLDPFMGSGTTGVACRKLNREFIGIELDPGYFEIAKQRIEHTPIQMALMEITT